MPLVRALDERAAAKAEERQEEACRRKRNGETKHDFDEIAHSAARISERQTNARHDDRNGPEYFSDGPFNGLQYAGERPFPRHGRSGGVGGLRHKYHHPGDKSSAENEPLI